MSNLINFDEYVNAQKKIINELASLETKSFETKKSYILRLKEVTRPLIENGYYDGVKLNDLASFIQTELLSKQGIEYPTNGNAYYNLFSEEEKREYNSTKSRNKISSLPIEKQTGDKTVDRLKQYARAEVKQPEQYEYSDYLNKIIEVANQTTKQAESLLSKLGRSYFFIEKFNETFPDKSKLKIEIESTNGKKQKELQALHKYYLDCSATIKLIESEIGITNDKIDELNETLSTQKFASKQLDERNKITFLEKWNSIAANITLGISAIAKKLSVNKKHLTNNVRPTSNPVTGNKNMHHEYIDWFKHIQIRTPNGETFTFDAKDYFDKQIERGKLNVKFEPLILSNARIEL